MKDYKLSEVKANCKKMYYADKPNEMPYLHCEICEHRRIKEFGKLWCEYIEEPINWQIDKDETKEQLIVDLNKVAVRMNWGTIERTINDDGTNGMPYMIDVIARTIAYLRGEQR